MRSICLIFSLLLFTSGFAQDTTQTVGNQAVSQSMQMTTTATGEPESYTLNNEEFKFIPDELGYQIIKMENGTEKEYGTLMETAEEGYFVLTSSLSDHVSYGRFDDSGNFRALRYDEREDKVLEENFMISSVSHKRD